MLTKAYIKGFSLIEFMIGMALSMAAILTVASIFITSFAVDSKSIKFSRLADEVATISALLSEDIKRAGYVNNAENLVTTISPAGNSSRCVGTPADEEDGCSHLALRTLIIAEYGGETADSCITFAYDRDNDGLYNAGDGNNSDAMGYRLKNDAIEIRKLSKLCTEGYWEKMTDPKFVTISALSFKACGQNDDTDVKCAAFNFPPVMPAPPAAQVIGSDVYRLSYSFTATLVDDNSVSLATSETVVVRNASYN